MHSVDLRRVIETELQEMSGEEEIELLHLSRTHLPPPNLFHFERIRSLSLRHLRARDLCLLELFPNVSVLEVWQSEDVHSLAGLQALRNLRSLSFMELGPLTSIQPLAALDTLEELSITGGVWKDQLLSGDFEPIAALRSLRKLRIAVRGPIALTPILDLPNLEQLDLSTSLYPIDEVSRVAAAYPFWRSKRPWLVRLGPEQDPEGCARCSAPRTLLYLQRKKRMWCEICEGDRLIKVLRAFDKLIDSHLH